jgi:SAM-dependent methyltransferase
MSRFMNPAEFANIARCEKDFWWYRGMRSILFRMLEPRLAGRRLARVLEAGCGTGYFSRLLQSERGWPVVPVDVSAEGLRYAREMGVGRLVQANILDLPFAAGSFDLALSVDVLPHLPRGEEVRAIREFARVLAPGGLLLIRAAALEILRSRHSQFAFERQRFTRSRLRGVAERAGLRVLRSTYANSLLMPVAVAKFRLWEPLLRRPPASGVDPVAPWLDRLLHAALAAEAAWIGAGRSFPAGQSLLLIAEKPR